MPSDTNLRREGKAPTPWDAPSFDHIYIFANDGTFLVMAPPEPEAELED